MLVVLGCSGGDGSLRVDLRTDFVPGVEFTEVRTIVDGSDSETRAFGISDEVFEAGRIADFESIDSGERRIEVTLLGPDGELASRTVRARVSGAVGITVLMTRDCRGVMCPGAGDDISALSCLGGSCVPEECVDGTGPDCGDSECMSATDCTMAAPCTSPVCVEGVCVYQRDDSQCGSDEYCDPDDGCLPIPMSSDAGFDGGSDVGFDGGFDGGTDVGTDAGTDAGDAWLDPTATHRLVIGHVPIGSALSDVPVLVRLTPDKFDFTTIADAAEIRFRRSDGTLVPHEIERFEAAIAWIWVTIDSVTAAANPEALTMYWGGDPPITRPSSEVWSTDYVAVLHMGSEQDSTANGNDTVWTNVAPASGSLGPNASFMASDMSYALMPASSSLATLDSITVSALVRHRMDQAMWSAVVTRQLGTGPQNDFWLGFHDNRYRTTLTTEDAPVGPNLTGPTRDLGAPTYIAMTYDGSTARLYADGVEVDSVALSGTLESSPNPVWIGADSNMSAMDTPDVDFIDAEIDEVRIQRVARSAQWIAVQQRSLLDALLTYGSIEAR